MASHDYLSLAEALDNISLFLEAAIHTTLYLRQVYPAELFERKKLHDVPVWRSRHPKLSSYVAGVVEAIIDRLREGTVEKAILAIKDATSDDALEYYVYKFDWLGGVTASMFPTDQERQTRPDTGTPRAHVEQLLRGLLLKLSSIDSQLSDLPRELTFTVFLEMTEGNAPPTEPDPMSGEVAPWVPDQTKAEERISTAVPLRRAALGPIALSLFAEETEAKIELEARRKARDVKGKGKARA